MPGAPTTAEIRARETQAERDKAARQQHVHANQQEAAYKSFVYKTFISYCKIKQLLDQNKSDEAYEEFTAHFVDATEKFANEAGNIAPASFQADRLWPRRVQFFLSLAKDLERSLKKRDITAARYALARIRKFFYVLHTENGIWLTNDAIYLFKQEVDGIAANNFDLKSFNADNLEKTRANILKARASVKVRSNRKAYDTALKQWWREVDTIMDVKPMTRQALARLKIVTDKFYGEYGIDFE